AAPPNTGWLTSCQHLATVHRPHRPRPAIPGHTATAASPTIRRRPTASPQKISCVAPPRLEVQCAAHKWAPGNRPRLDLDPGVKRKPISAGDPHHVVPGPRYRRQGPPSRRPGDVPRPGADTRPIFPLARRPGGPGATETELRRRTINVGPV